MNELSKQNISRLRSMIDAYYLGTASVEEERELLSTLNYHAGHLPADLEEEYRILKSIDPAAGISDKSDSDDITVFCENIIDKLAAENNHHAHRNKWQRLFISRYIVVAASVVAILAIGIAIFTYSPQQKQVISYVQPAEKAIVVTAPQQTVDSTIVPQSSKLVTFKPVVTHNRASGRVVMLARDTVNNVSQQMVCEITDTAEAIQRIEQVMNMLADKCDKVSRASEVSKEVISKTKETLNTYLSYEKVI